MAFIRRVGTASGATAVQIAEYAGGRQRIVKHVGSADTEAELGVLLARAWELLEDPAQGVLDLGVEPELPVKGLAGQATQAALFEPAESLPTSGFDGPGRVLGTDSRVLFEALAGVYCDLGFDAVGDEVFRDLVIARVVEPTSLLDVERVLGDLGRSAGSYSTMRRTLVRAHKGEYRDQVATACFKRAVSRGDVSLVLYDVTVRHEALVVRVEVRDLRQGFCRSRAVKLGAVWPGRRPVGREAAPTKPWRASTVRWCACGEHDEEVYARNRCHHLS